MVKPYPASWHRRLDFLPPLGLQIAVGERDLELYFCYTSVSVQEPTSRMPSETTTEYGKLKVNPAFRNIVDYEMGNPNPRNGIHPIPQREILNDITDYMGGAVKIVGEMPDVVIKSRGVVERIPKEVEELDAFQGSEYVFYLQNAYGNFVHKVRKALNMRYIENPYRFMKADLLNYRIIRSPHDPVLKKLRSTLKTEFIVADTYGWSHFGDPNILALEQALTRNRWWTDIGRPTPFQIPINSGIQGQIYQLLRRQCIVVV